VPADALALALLAAVVHAAWNLLLSGAPSPERAAGVALGVAAVALVPFGVATWDVAAQAWPYIAGSIAFEVAYVVLLGRAYARADLGFVYPVARGAGPVLVLGAGVVALGVRPSPAEVAGVLGVVAGIVLVRGVERGSGLGLALAVGASLAGYTLVDDRGIEHAAAVPYLMAVLVPTAAIVLAADAARGRAPGDALGARTALAGVAMAGAYLLTLAALDRAAAAPVAAVRETSVLIALAAVALAGRERVTPSRGAGGVLVVAGVVALALG
jgi:drug/metabolite transporter (DMT)-like permease